MLGAGIDCSQIAFGTGSLMIDLGGGEAIHLMGWDPFDPLSSPILDRIEFADGSITTYQDVLDQGFDLDGTEGDDLIEGTAVTVRARAATTGSSPGRVTMPFSAVTEMTISTPARAMT